jgi:ethanolamine permease
MYHLLVTIGLLGLVASFHGIILAAGRATFEFGRVGYIPKAIGKIHSRFKTPSSALILNMLIGIAALLTGKTGDIIIMACFGALTLYIVSMITLMVLRKREPQLQRPYKVPFYPLMPVLALVVSSVSLIAMTTLNLQIAIIYFAILAITFAGFRLYYKKKNDAATIDV